MIAITPRMPQAQFVRQERLIDANQQIQIAPIGGLNTRDPLSAMPPEDAIQLDNWIPGTGSVITRPGYASHTTGFDSQVESLMEYDDGTNQTFFAGSGAKIQSFSETTGGTASDEVTGLSNARWQHINFNGNLVCVNGADTPRSYNNAGGWSTVSLTGPTATSLDGVNVFKNRVYYWDSSAQSFWYGGVNAFAGTFTEFPLSRVSQTGGSLVAMGNITRDGGAGVDDLACFIMSTGEVIIYQGDNPGSANDWALVGRYRIPRPINSPRAVVRYQGDLNVVTESDVISVSQTIKYNGANISPSKISGQKGIEGAANQYKNNYGWQAILYAAGDLLIYNVPVSTNSMYWQYAQNIVTGAWCRLKDIEARCFGVLNGKLYFGGNQTVYIFDNDNFSDAGSDINCTAQPAYTLFGVPNRKRFISGRFVFNSASDLSISSGVGVDYEDPLIAQAGSSTSSGTAWDDGDWGDFFWADEAQPQLIPFTAGRQGTAISPKVRISVSGARCSLYRIDYNFEVLRAF